MEEQKQKTPEPMRIRTRSNLRSDQNKRRDSMLSRKDNISQHVYAQDNVQRNPYGLDTIDKPKAEPNKRVINYKEWQK